MEFVEDIAQTVADTSIHVQKYFWNLVGIEPDRAVKEVLSIEPDRAVKEVLSIEPDRAVKEVLSIEPDRAVKEVLKSLHLHEELGIGSSSRSSGFDVEMFSIRLAALSGATAVMSSAYGAHKVLMDPTIDARRIKAFENANRYHFIHTLALLCAGRASKPALTTALFTGGILLFCGPCYVFALKNNEEVRKVTPFGGILLILGWLSFAL